MTKISVKTKLKAVEEYANGNVTLASVRHKYGTIKRKNTAEMTCTPRVGNQLWVYFI